MLRDFLLGAMIAMGVLIMICIFVGSTFLAVVGFTNLHAGATLGSVLGFALFGGLIGVAIGPGRWHRG